MTCLNEKLELNSSTFILPKYPCAYPTVQEHIQYVLWKLKCGSFCFLGPLERAHITGLWASERHTLYKYTPLKGLWGSRTHAYTQTVQEVLLTLPLQPSNVGLSFYLTPDSFITGPNRSLKNNITVFSGP